MIRAYAAKEAGGRLEPFEFDPGPLAADDVEIAVESCGICHSDLSMLQNDWGFSTFPLVPGHEVIGRVSSLGEHVSHLQLGQRVGLGWISTSCMSCHSCMQGQQNLCATAQPTIAGRHGGFADKVRCSAAWAIPLPQGLDHNKAGPLFCGGLTVFSPIMEFGVKPVDRVGVVGVGGLGHLALQFLNRWGCEVTAFTSSAGKFDELIQLGAHHVVNSRDSKQIGKQAGTLDFILSTVNVDLDWGTYLSALRPNGRLHTVGAIADPMSIPAMDLIMGQRSVSGSPVGSPAATHQMLEFCARHGIEATTEAFPMSRANEAMAHLKDGKARYRIVLQNDFQ